MSNVRSRITAIIEDYCFPVDGEGHLDTELVDLTVNEIMTVVMQWFSHPIAGSGAKSHIEIWGGEEL